MIREILLRPGLARLAYRAAGWHLRYLSGRRPSPLACGYYITSRCNFKCGFCNIWRLKPGFRVPEEEAVAAVSELGKLGVVYFSISGGEPLTVPYVFRLLDLARRSGILYTHLVSNGYLMDEDRARELSACRVSEVSFSLDGSRAEHDAKRRTEGAYDGVLRAVENVRKHAPRTGIVLNSILEPMRPGDALAAVDTAVRLGVKIKVQPANDHPDFGSEDPATRTVRDMPPESRRELTAAIDSLLSNPSVVNSRAFLTNYKRFLFSPDRLMLSGKDCIFGFHHIEFFGGRAFPCLEGMGWEDGFDVSGGINAVLSSPGYLDTLDTLRRCDGCRRNYYVCYYEPRLSFPVWNLASSTLKTMLGGRP